MCQWLVHTPQCSISQNKVFCDCPMLPTQQNWGNTQGNTFCHSHGWSSCAANPANKSSLYDLLCRTPPTCNGCLFSKLEETSSTHKTKSQLHIAMGLGGCGKTTVTSLTTWPGNTLFTFNNQSHAEGFRIKTFPLH